MCLIEETVGKKLNSVVVIYHGRRKKHVKMRMRWINNKEEEKARCEKEVSEKRALIYSCLVCGDGV